MKRICSLILLVVLLLLSLSLYGQNEGNIWYFGRYAGLDFNSGTPVALTNSAMSTNEGCASICDANGSLLFYTDGSTVWNRNHQVMTNGSGLMGSFTSTQSAVIVQKPNSNNLYYIFTVAAQAASGGMRYSVVDINLQGGLGAVTTTKNVLVVTPTCEKITAVKHQNGSDFWIITRLWNSSNFNSYLLTSAGFNNSPVTSSVGVFLSGWNAYTVGYLTASLNGTKIASANDYVSNVEIFDFNKSTGMLSNPLLLTNFNGLGAYGVQFSPNGFYLYVSEEASFNTSVYQYDLTVGNQLAINNSRITVGTSTTSGGALQLAPDGKIYHAKVISDYLGVINNPDNLGLSCNYVSNGVYLNGNKSYFGLPTFYSSITAPQIIVSIADTCLGDSTAFSVTLDTSYSVYWNFGDTASGIHNFSNLFDVKHYYVDTGYYTVTLITQLGLYSDTLVYTIHISNTPVINLGTDTTLCTGQGIFLNALYPNATYQWQNGSSFPVVYTYTPGIYWVDVINACGTIRDSIEVSWLDPPNIQLPNDTLLCIGDTMLLNPLTNEISYVWQNGSSDSTFNVYQAGTYWVEASNMCGTDSDSILVDYLTEPIVKLGPDTVLCLSDSLVLNASFSHSTYQWQNASTDSLFTVSQPGLYWVEVSNQCGVDVDSINIQYIDVPYFSLINDTVLCEGDTLAITINDTISIYMWSNGQTANSANIYQEGVYWLQLSNQCGITTDTLVVDYDSIPLISLGNDTSLCTGVPLVLTVDSPYTFYNWQYNLKDSLFTIFESGKYWAMASDKCGTTTDTIEVEYKSAPQINLGDNKIMCDGETITLNVFYPSTNYQWHDNSNSSSYIVNSEGLYWVNASNECGSAYDEVYVTYISEPQVDLSGDTILCYTKIMELDATNPYSTYLWQDYSDQPTYQVNYPGTYWVKVSNKCGVVSDTVEIELIDCECFLYMPNAFSPNNDQVNDTFEPVGNCPFSSYNFLVFNRWGQKLFESNTPNKVWDGTFNGQVVSLGVYVYLFDYSFNEGMRQIEKGYFTLVK